MSAVTSENDFRSDGVSFLGHTMSDSLIYFGGAIKALDDNGKVGGYLVRFTSADRRDLTGEYFTAKTYLGAHDGDGVDAVFHHGQSIPIKAKVTAKTAQEIQALTDHVFAPVKTKRDAVGIWAETVLDMADEYEKAVFGMVKNNKLGWSSGAVGHLVRKTDDGEIKRWPIGEASLTPTPAEPLNRALTVKSLEGVKYAELGEEVEATEEEKDSISANKSGKSLAVVLNQWIDDRADDGGARNAIIRHMAAGAGLALKEVEQILSGDIARPVDAHLKAFARALGVEFDILKSALRRDRLQTIKGMFEEALAEHVPSRWELESIYCRIVKKLANAASAAQMAGVSFDLEAKVKEATDEYTGLLQKHALGQIKDWMEEGGEDDFYLKALVDPSKDALSDIQIDLSDHSELLVSGLKSVVARYRGNHEQRVKAGRVLSEKNRKRISTLMEQMKGVHDDLQNLLDESVPMATDIQKRAALTRHLMLKIQHRASLGV